MNLLKRIQKSDNDKIQALRIPFLLIALSLNALIFFIAHSAWSGTAVNEKNQGQIISTQPGNSDESISESSVINDQPQSVVTISPDQITQQPRSCFQVVQDNYKSKKNTLSLGRR